MTESERRAKEIIELSIKCCQDCGDIISQMNMQICFLSGALSLYDPDNCPKEACKSTLERFAYMFKIDEDANLDRNFITDLFKHEFIAARGLSCKAKN